MKKAILACLIPLVLLAPSLLSGQTKAALVIGNGAYTGLGTLKNPANDAADMAAALRGLGFQVELLTNAGLPAMEQAVIKLGSRLAGSAEAVGFFFYAGHGVQSGGVNYLIPADARIAGEAFLKTKALSVQALLDTMQGSGNKLNLIVLDACRDNPFSWGRSGSRGLTMVGQQPPGSIIVYATSAGGVAQDGRGRNGVFTGELLKNLKSSGLDISEVFRRTGAGVRTVTAGAQVPALYSQFFDQYQLAGPSAAAPAAQPQPAPAAQPAPAPGAARPAAVTDLVWVEGGTFSMGDTFGDGEPGERPTHPVTVSGFRMAKTEVTVAGFRRFIEETGYQTEAETSNGGTIYNGLKWEPAEDASWKKPYQISGDDHPVTLVSWYDAVFFCNWLSEKEGLRPAYSIGITSVRVDWSAPGYRLPTEAEWEYAARGGQLSRGYRYAGGNNLDAVAWYLRNNRTGAQPVGRKQPNELGLYDLSGNVWEWCWDWSGAYTPSAHSDLKDRSPGDPRVCRGGGWGGDVALQRVTVRNPIYPTYRDGNLGFRVVRN